MKVVNKFTGTCKTCVANSNFTRMTIETTDEELLETSILTVDCHTCDGEIDLVREG